MLYIIRYTIKSEMLDSRGRPWENILTHPVPTPVRPDPNTSQARSHETGEIQR